MSSLQNNDLDAASFPGDSRRHIRNIIALGNVLPGERIDEAAVARDLGISRTPVREALRSLAAERLVEVRPGVGFIVRRLSTEQLRQNYEIRALVEGDAAERAARLITAEDLWQLEQHLSRSEFLSRPTGDGGPNIAALTQSSHSFHESVVCASRNEFAEHIVKQLSLRPLAYRALTWATARERADSQQAHRDIYMALTREDGVCARELLVAHLAANEVILLRGLADHPEYLQSSAALTTELGREGRSQ